MPHNHKEIVARRLQECTVRTGGGEGGTAYWGRGPRRLETAQHVTPVAPTSPWGIRQGLGVQSLHPGMQWLSPCAPPCSVWLLLLYGALDSHPFFSSHVASGRCFLSAAAAGALAGVVSAFAEPSSWCVGAVLNVAWCAICVSGAQ